MKISTGIRAIAVFAVMSLAGGCFFGSGNHKGTEVSAGYFSRRPPDKRTETVPPRPDQISVWVGGHWNGNNGSDYSWSDGSWQHPDAGKTSWHDGSWNKEDKGWRYTEGYWQP